MGIENRGNEMETHDTFEMWGTPAAGWNVPDSEQRQFSTLPSTQDLVKLLIRLFTSKKILSSFRSPSAPEVKAFLSALIITDVALYEWRPQFYPGLAFAFKLKCFFFQSTHTAICLMLWILSIAFRENTWDFTQARSFFNQKSEPSVTSARTASCASSGWIEEVEVYEQHCRRKHRNLFQQGNEILSCMGQWQNCWAN